MLLFAVGYLNWEGYYVYGMCGLLPVCRFGLKLLVWFALGERASSLGFLIEQVAWVGLGGIASGWSWFGF